MTNRPRRLKPSERAELEQQASPPESLDDAPVKKPKRRRTGPKPTKRAKVELEEAIKHERLVPNKGCRTWQPNARDLEIYQAYCEGDKTQRELAADYKLAVSSVNEIIHKVEVYIASKSIMEIRSLRARATQRFESIYAKAIQSYKKSLEDEVTITTEQGGEHDKRSEKRRGQAGSAAFLAQAREAMSDLLDVWGAKAPKVLHEIHEAMRVGGKSPEEAARTRLAHLQSLVESFGGEGNVDSDSRPDSDG